MARSAAEAGIREAAEFFSMTPWEISLLIAAHAAREQKTAENRWLLARLIALSVHAPEKLPGPPPIRHGREMTDEEMKQRLLSWRRKDEK